MNCKVAVMDNKYVKSGQPILKVMNLKELLETRFKTDAHLVTYIEEPIQDFQCRVKKTDYDKIKNIKTTCFIADCDNPGHKPHSNENPEILKGNIPDYAGLGIYITKNGYRLIQILSEPIPVNTTERHLKRWLFSLEERGFPVDFQACDWTRLFRCPNIVRDGVVYNSPLIDLSRMESLDIDILDVDCIDTSLPSNSADTLELTISSWSSTITPEYESLAIRLAKELKRIHDPWHNVFMGLAGSLMTKGKVPAELLPSLCRRISELAGDSRHSDREAIGRTTAIKRLNKLPTKGYTWLSLKYPRLARAITEDIPEEKVELKNSKELEQVSLEIGKIISEVDDEIILLKAPPGVGKTYHAIKTAIERSVEVKDNRTALSFDKNILAEQSTHDAEKQGAGVKRIFGPMSLKDEDGNLECKFTEVAIPLVEGGISVYFELCLGRNKEPCPYFDTCQAKTGWVGSNDANIFISNHAKLKTLREEVGGGILVIDEPPAPLTNFILTKEQINHVVKNLDKIEYWYVEKVKQYVLRIQAWEDENLSFQELTQDIDLYSLINEETQTRKRGQHKSEGKLTRKMKPEQAKEVGKIIKTLDILVRAKVEKSLVELKDDEIKITLANEILFDVLKHKQRTVITDANADLILPYINSILGEESVSFKDYTHIPDSCDMERVLLKVKGATRSNWLWKGKVKFDSGLLEAFKWITQFHRQGNKLGIITFKPIADLMRKEDSRIPEELRRLKPSIQHYYGSRGLNNMMNCNELVTIGDPYMSMDAVKNNFEFLKLNIDRRDFELKLCKAELEQSHGRLRAVRRNTPARAMHIGQITPGGFGWDKAIIKYAPRLGGSIMSAQEMKNILESNNISQRELAIQLKTSETNVSRYIMGQRSIPHEVAKEVKLLESKVIQLKTGKSK